MAGLKQAYRDQFEHWIDTTPGTSETYVREGTGVKSLQMAYNPQVSQEKDITQRNADAVFDGYQVQTSISDKRIYVEGDPMWKFLNDARKSGKPIETTMLEIDKTSSSGEGPSTKFETLKYNILIVITDFLGENATIGYDIYVKGDAQEGTVTISGQKPTFAPKVVL